MLAFIVSLTGCAKVNIPWIHKIDIQQGNVVTQDMLDKLELGMEKRKVRFILGTPLTVSAFSPDRWDYIYTYRTGGEDTEQRRVSVFFQDDKLHHIDGNVVPHGTSGAVPRGAALKQTRELPNRTGQ